MYKKLNYKIHPIKTRQRKYNPCPECSDTGSQLAKVDVLTGAVQLLTPIGDHVSR